MKKVLSAVLALAMAVSLVATPDGAQAAKKMKLSKVKAKLKVGKTLKLKVKNKKGKVTWKSTKKKVATVSKKGVVKALKKGKAIIKATVKRGKKKQVLKCKITVVNKKKTKKKASATVAPKAATPTPAIMTSKPMPSETPVPVDVNNAKLWNDKDGVFDISGISFGEDKHIYQYIDSKVCVIDGKEKRIKNVVKDLKKCAFDVKLGDKTVKNVVIDKISHSNEPWFSDGNIEDYYSFNLYVYKDGVTYYRTFFMMVSSGDYGVYSIENLEFSDFSYDGKKIELEKAIDKFNTFYFNLGDNKSIKELIPDIKKVTFKATCGGEKFENAKIVHCQWIGDSMYKNNKDEGYYSCIMNGKIKGDDTMIRVVFAEYNSAIMINRIVDSSLKPLDIVDFSNKDKHKILVKLRKGESLKDKFKALDSEYNVSVLYKNKVYHNVELKNFKWSDVPKYEDISDEGCYSFDVEIIDNGKTVKRTFYLCAVHSYMDTPEANNTESHTLSGVMTDEDGNPCANEELNIYKRIYEDGEYYFSHFEYVETDSNGKYSRELSQGEYYIADKLHVNDRMFTITDSDVVIDLRTNFVKTNIAITLNGKPLSDNYITLYVGNSEDDQSLYLNLDKDGKTTCYLPEGRVAVNFEEDYVEKQVVKSQDISVDFGYTQVSGNAYSANGDIIEDGSIKFVQEGVESSSRAYIWQGKYSCFIKSDADADLIYEYCDKSVTLGHISATKDPVSKDLNVPLYKITATLKSANGMSVSGESVHFDCQNPDIIHSGEDDEPGNVEYARTDKHGVASIMVLPGEYDVYAPYAREDSSEKSSVEVTDSDVNVDVVLKADFYHVRGKVSALGEVQTSRKLTFVNSKDKYADRQSVVTDEDGYYDILLKKGEYKVYPNVCSKAAKVITVDKDMNIDLDFEMYRIYGTVTTNGEIKRGDAYSVKVFKKLSPEEGTKKIRSKDLYCNGSYSFWIAEKGDVTIYFDNDRVADVTIDKLNTRVDVANKVYNVSGKVTNCKDDTVYIEFRRKETGTGKWFITTEKDNYAYSVDMPKGEYEIRINDLVVDTLVVEDNDTMQDIKAPTLYEVKLDLTINGTKSIREGIVVYKHDGYKEKIMYDYCDVGPSGTVYLPAGKYSFAFYSEEYVSSGETAVFEIDEDTDVVYDYLT
ncbi:Ig-like domain-containing protein [Eubacterium xylanophilum]|uniref:Ig-like domain-containing protein n=1 Tax=Eubacterium xylanophilum TaxID=39497 RepID=UPI000479FF6B|nr:Ig-like domain-containing protein [Eubacterium xylanophilum]